MSDNLPIFKGMVAFNHFFFIIYIIVEPVDAAMPGTSFELPPPYEQPGCAPPTYPGAMNVTSTHTSLNMVSDEPIPMYKH